MIARALEDSEVEDERDNEEVIFRPDEESSTSENEDDEAEAVTINSNSQSVSWNKRKFTGKDLPSRERPESMEI